MSSKFLTANGKLANQVSGSVVRCKCGSYAINAHAHGRKHGVDLDLCDVCYWRKRFDKQRAALADIRELIGTEDDEWVLLPEIDLICQKALPE